MLTLIVALLLTQPSPTAQPNYPHKAATPTTPVATTQPSAIDQLSMPQRRIINERAKDFYLLPDAATGGFTFADAYRLHRIRELLAKGTGEEPWNKINYSDALKLGMGHIENDPNHGVKYGVKQRGTSAPLARPRQNDSVQPTYKDLPELVSISRAGDYKDAITVCEAPHMGAEPLQYGLIYNGGIPQIETSPRCFTTIPHKVTLVQILDEHNAIAKMSYIRVSTPPAGIPKEGFHITGPTTGMHDGQVYPGDFILIPQGTEHYKNFAGVRATTASYQLIPLTTPITPEALAQAVKEGRATINTYTITSKPGGYEWKSAPIKFIFKP